MKENMNQFVDAATRQGRIFGQCLQVVLAILLFGMVQSAFGQTNFSTAMTIYGDYGNVVVDNTGVVPDTGAPTIAGLAPANTIWFQWSTTNSGEVTFDTMGSVDDFLGVYNLDTVMGVYTGSDLATLGLVTANDEAYAYPQYNLQAQTSYSFGDTNYNSSTNQPPSARTSIYYMTQPFYGPSQIRFNAVAGQNYYIAVDTRLLPGNVSLNWSLHPSGVFRFATESSDMLGATYADGSTPMLLYTCAATEGSLSVKSGTPIRYSLLNPLGVLVTVTRVGGAYGRVTVDYSASMIDTNSLLLNTNGFLVNGDIPAQSSQVVTPYFTNQVTGTVYYLTNTVSGADFTPVSGTLTFDDYEMSKKILIPIQSSGKARPNADFLVTLSNPQVDPAESAAISPPRVDNIFSQALVRILNVNVDPKYSYSGQVSNAVTGNLDTFYRLNNPTNSVFNFQRAHYYVYRAKQGNSFTIYVNRSGTNTSAQSIFYKVNSEYPYTKNGLQENGDNEFPLQPGSDYATPSPATTANILGKATDFVFDSGYTGTVSWGDKDFNQKEISFQIYDNGLEQFNEDFKISLYDLDSNGNPFQLGMVADTYVTILNAREMDNSSGTNELYLPAGSIDELYNPDYSSQFWLNQQQRAHPGTSGEVLGIALQADGSSVLVGNFSTYNGTSVGCIAKVDTNGYLDQTFNTSDAVNTTDGSYVSCVITNAVGQILIGGNFTSYSGGYCRYIALLNSDGSLDPTFTQNVGDGFDAPVSSLILQPDGKILVGGSFATYNGVTRNFMARLNADGTLDTTFDATTNLNAAVNAMALQPNGQVVLGGQFTNLRGVTGQSYVGRLNADGSIDASFDPGAGADAPVNAVAVQPDGKIVVGGDFYQINGKVLSHIARLYTNGLLDTAFGCVYGTDGSVYNLNIQTNSVYSTYDPSVVSQTNFTIYVGGQFTTVNGTHRLGFARLNADGALDTSFMDTAYNQFAGLTRQYYGDPVSAVLAAAIQPDGNILIGGTFDQVGGGEFNGYVRTNSFVGAYAAQPFVRSAVRNHSNFARIIGGGTPGPGNVTLALSSYSVNKSAGSLFVSLMRTNGDLGIAAANFEVIPGQAQSGVDYFYNGNYNGTTPLYPSVWSRARMHGDGYWGGNLVLQDDWGGLNSGLDTAWINLTVTGNTNSYANLSAQFQLSNPLDRDQFYLGGEDIPLGIALGANSSAPLTLVEDRHQSGTVSFSQSTYVSSGPTAPISVIRTNGTYGIVTVSYLTTTNNTTAIVNTDYKLVGTSNTVSIANGASTANFNITIIGSNYNSSVEKTVGLLLSGVSAPYDGLAYLGVTNAILRIINPNFQGFLGFTATNYGAKLSSNSVSFTVARTVGNKGLLTVQYATVNGTATNGIDYVGQTNTLTWNSGDYTNKVVTISLLNPGTVGVSRQFSLRLSNPQSYGSNAPALFAADSITNATVMITNDNSYGTFQFASPAYVVNENGGVSTITVIRTGATNGTATVQCATTNGPAISGVNYVGVTNTLTFVPGQLAASFNVTILNDGIVDPAPANFYFTASLSNPNTGSLLGSVTTTTNYIVDATSLNRPSGDNDSSFSTGTGMDADVLAVDLQSSGKIIAGGNFGAVGGVPESHLARLNVDGSLDYTGFLYGMAGVNSSVYALKVQTDDKILIGGTFTTLNGLVRNRISRLLTDGTTDTSFNPGAGANSTVYGLAETFMSGARKVYAVGAFTTMNGATRARVARLNDNGSLDTTFSAGTGPNGVVYAVAIYPTNSVLAGKSIIGGAFTNISGITYSYIARLNSDGSVDTNFAPGLSIDNSVRAVAIQYDGKVLLGGDFTNVNGAARLHLARLNADGSLDTTFAGNIGTSTNGTVNTILVQSDNRIVVGGQFLQANGLTRNNITRLMANGAADPTINFGSGANGAVDSIVIQPADQMLVLAGAFTTYNDQTASHIARIYGGSETGSGSLQFTSASYQVNENGAQALIGIRRTGGSSGPNADGTGDITVSFLTQPGSTNPAVAGVNYSNATQTVTFPAGEVLRYVPITVMQDSNITPNLTVALTLTNVALPAKLGDQYLSQLTIVNVDSAVSFGNSSYLVDKAILTGFASLQIVRLGTTVGTASVDYWTTTNGTAVIGTDYYATNGTVTFAPGETNKTIQVSVINNGLVEGNRTVSLILSNAVGAPLMAPTNTVLTIQDSTKAAGSVYFTATSFTASSGNAYATLSLARTNGTSGDISVAYTTVAGTAQAGVDFQATTGTTTVKDGTSTGTISIPLINNGTAKAISTFGVNLSLVGTNGALIDPTNATVSIINTNSGVGFVSATNTVAEDAGSALIYVQRYGFTNGTTTVNYGFTNVTATSGVNYQGVNGTLTFYPGEAQKPISVPLIHNTAVTGDLLFNIGLAQPQSGTALVSPATTTVVVQDAEAGFSFTNSTMTVSKNAGVAVVTVICSNPRVEPVIQSSNDIPLEVSYATTDGTAVAGSEYGAVSGTLVFTNGIGTNTFTVPIYNNGLVTGDRNFTVALSSPTAPGQLITPSTQTVVISEYNSGVAFSKANYTAFKNGISTTIDVYRTGYTDRVVTVNFLATNGTAVNGVNFVSTNGTLQFTNGVTKQSFNVPLIASTKVQPNLTVQLQLSGPGNALLASPNAATLTLLENSGSYVVPAGAQVVTNYTTHATDGIIHSNDTVQVLFALRVGAGLQTTNLIAYLLATNGVSAVSPSSQTYGALIPYHHSVSKAFSFTATGTNNLTMAPTFALYDNGTYLGTAVFGFTLGTWTNVFANTNQIVISANGSASPYPAVITVSGPGSTLEHATVTLTNMNQSVGRDVSALVVSPAGKSTLIMSGAGGVNKITRATLTFDDNATTTLPQSGQIVTGTNQPTAYSIPTKFP